jgi:hypothetical protein
MFENFKTMVTDDCRRSHPKFMGEKSVKNTIAYFLTTNNRNCMPASQNDRRNFFVTVRPTHLNDIPYFTRLGECIDNQWQLIIRYILTFKVDMSTPAIPETALRRHAKSLKLDSIGYWLLEKVQSTEWIPSASDNFQVKDFYEEYCQYCKSVPVRSYTRNKFLGKLADKYHIDISGTVDKVQVLAISDLDCFVKIIGWSGEKNTDKPPFGVPLV